LYQNTTDSNYPEHLIILTRAIERDNKQVR